MCEHLAPLENYLKGSGIAETYRGQPWSQNCNEWIYYDCNLDLETLAQRFKWPDFIEKHINDDPKSGTEKGFVCTKCNDAIMGKLEGGKVIPPPEAS